MKSERDQLILAAIMDEANKVRSLEQILNDVYDAGFDTAMEMGR